MLFGVVSYGNPISKIFQHAIIKYQPEDKGGGIQRKRQRDRNLDNNRLLEWSQPLHNSKLYRVIHGISQGANQTIKPNLASLKTSSRNACIPQTFILYCYLGGRLYLICIMLLNMIMHKMSKII